MAVKKSSNPMIKHYWPRYRRKAVILTIAMQFILTAFVGGAIIIAGFDSTSFEFWIVLLAIIAASLGLNVFLILSLLTPLRDLTAALTHVAGEPSTVIPPNPNAPYFEKDGFKPLLQYLYASAASAGEVTDTKGEAPTEALSRALNQTSAGIVVLDAEGAIIYANKKAPISTEMDGKIKLDLLFARENEFETWVANCRANAVHAEKTWQRVADKIVGEEGRRIFDIAATYEKGSAAEVVLVALDQTTSYQPEDDELDFIAFAAHELRGPITVIRGYLDVLAMEASDNITPDQDELLKRLVVSSNRLSGYINNILNASRFDRRHLRVHLAEDTLAGVYETINDDMQLRASSQNRLLTVSIPDDLPPIAADRSSLSEVMGNLIDNAIKYSNEGGTIKVMAVQDGSYVKMLVEDHGIGMPSSVIGNLFHKFYRSHRSRETVGGTGIGLYISKAIVESHGGTIGVKSIEGEGSIFTFTVPTYESVKDKLQANDFTNTGLINNGSGWIKNHSMYKG